MFSLLLEIGQARLGWRLWHRLSSGVEIDLFSERDLATKQWVAATEIKLLNGHDGTK